MGSFCSHQHQLYIRGFGYIAYLLGTLVQIAFSLQLIWYFLDSFGFCFDLTRSFFLMTRESCPSCEFTVQQDYEFEIGQLMRFTFRELQTATGNFSLKNILGQGGYGVVYKGCLPNGTLVAVKRLKDPNYTGEVQFQTEVEMIGLALHRNLLRLYGFCMTPEERMLVYPYMPNGSVADRLRGLILLFCELANCCVLDPFLIFICSFEIRRRDSRQLLMVIDCP